MDEQDYNAMNKMGEPNAMNEREILIEEALFFYNKVVNHIRPNIIFIITNETNQTVLSAYYNAADAMAKCKILKEINPTKKIWVIELQIN